MRSWLKRSPKTTTICCTSSSKAKTISAEELKDSLRKSTIALKVFPVVVGTAFKNKGIQPLLDAVVDYLPSPLDTPETKGVNPDTGEEMLSAKPTTKSHSRLWLSRSWLIRLSAS